MILYNAKTTAEGIRFAKFNNEMDIEAVYTVKDNTCDCPAGVRPTCKHRKMVPIFQARKAIDTPWFYDYEHQFWHQPVQISHDQEADPTAEKAVAATSDEVARLDRHLRRQDEALEAAAVDKPMRRI